MSKLSSLPVTPSTNAPHLRAVPAGPGPAPQPDPSGPGLGSLPAGTTVLGAWPPGALPEGILGQFHAAQETPMVGYFVLVPAGTSPAELGLAVPAAPAPAVPVAADPGIRLDPERRTAQVDGRALDLTYLEFELLAHLTAHPHRVHTRDHLVTAVWGYGHVGDGRTVDVHVARLRRKLGAEHRASIVTIRRVGYKYVPQHHR